MTFEVQRGVLMAVLRVVSHVNSGVSRLCRSGPQCCVWFDVWGVHSRVRDNVGPSSLCRCFYSKGMYFVISEQEMWIS